MYRVQLGAFDFGKDEVSSPREAIDKLIETLKEIGQEDLWHQLCYEVDDLDGDSLEVIDLAEEN